MIVWFWQHRNTEKIQVKPTFLVVKSFCVVFSLGRFPLKLPALKQTLRGFRGWFWMPHQSERGCDSLCSLSEDLSEWLSCQQATGEFSLTARCSVTQYNYGFLHLFKRPRTVSSRNTSTHCIGYKWLYLQQKQALITCSLHCQYWMQVPRHN